MLSSHDRFVSRKYSVPGKSWNLLFLNPFGSIKKKTSPESYEIFCLFHDTLSTVAEKFFVYTFVQC